MPDALTAYYVHHYPHTAIHKVVGSTLHFDQDRPMIIKHLLSSTAVKKS